MMDLSTTYLGLRLPHPLIQASRNNFRNIFGGITMAYDPEARQQSNSAMTIGIVALALLALGAVAYFATRHDDVVATAPVVTHTGQGDFVIFTRKPR